MANLVTEANTSFLSGMLDSAPPASYRADQAATLLNLRVDEQGAAVVRNGSQRTHSSARNAGALSYGLVEFVTASGVRQLINFPGDIAEYSTDEGATWNSISGATGLRQDYWSFATMRVGSENRLYCANGSNTLYEWDGTTWSTETGPTTGCTLLAVHQERLWAAKGQTLYASKPGDPATWVAPDGLSLPVLTHDGDSGITGLYPLGPVLLVWKRRSMGYVEGYGRANVIVAAGSRGVSRDVGCIAFRSLVGVGGGGVMWLSERGFEYYQMGGQPSLVSREVEGALADVNWSEIEANPGVPWGLFYPRKLAYECRLPSAGAQNDMVFVYRLPVGDRPGAASLFDSATEEGRTLGLDATGHLELDGGSRIRIVGGYLTLASGSTPGQYIELDATGHIVPATNDAVSASGCVADRGSETSAPVGAGYDGFVRNLDTGLLDDVLSDGTGGVPINDRLLARPMVFRDPFRKKKARVVRVQVIAERDVTPSVRVLGDGSAGNSHTLSIPASTGGAPREGKARVSKKGDTLQVEVSGAGAGTKISGIALDAEMLRERP